MVKFSLKRLVFALATAFCIFWLSACASAKRTALVDASHLYSHELEKAKVSAVIAPFHTSDARTYAEVMKKFEGAGIDEFLRKADDVARAIGLAGYDIQRNIGGYEGMLEPSFTFVFESNADEPFADLTEKAKLFASIVGDIGYETQDAVIVFYDDEFGVGDDLFYSADIPLANLEAPVSNSASIGLDDFTIRIDDRLLYMLFFDDYRNAESLAGMNSSIDSIIGSLQKLGGYDDSRKTERKVRRSAYMDAGYRHSVYAKWNVILDSDAGRKKVVDPFTLKKLIADAQKALEGLNDYMSAAI